jgi:membrane protein
MGAGVGLSHRFSIAPIRLIAMTVAGYLFGPQVPETQVLKQLAALIGSTGADAIRDLLLNPHYNDMNGFAAAVGIAALVVGATSVLAKLRRA